MPGQRNRGRDREKFERENRLPNPREQAVFLARLADGLNVTEALKSTGLPRRGVYRLRREDPAFELAWVEAIDAYHATLTQPFLEALAEGRSVADACRFAGVSPEYIRVRRRRDSVFAADYEAAYTDGADALEDEARRRAVEGVEEPVFHRGEVVGSVRKYSDPMLMFLLKGRRPDRFATTRAKVEVDGGLSPDELEAIRRLGANPEYADALDKVAEGFAGGDG